MLYKNLTDSQLANIFEGVDFQTPPRHHQLVSIAWVMDNRNRISLWHDIGTGKSLIALYCIYLWWTNRALIVCPNSVIPSWIEQIEKHTRFTYTILKGMREDRRKKISENTDLFICNYEGLASLFGHREEVLGQKAKTKFVMDYELITQACFDTVVFDECHKLKEHKAIQSHLAHALSKQAQRCIIMTGTPTSKSPADLFGEYWVLDNGNSLGTSRTRFLNNYFRRAWYDWKVTDIGMKRILEKISPVTLRYSREECFDLPDKTYQIRLVDMTTEQRKLTNAIITDTKVKLEKGSLPVLDILQQGNKLSQIAGGFVIGTKGLVRLKKNPKLEELKNLLSEIKGKALIFHNYVEEGRAISEILDREKIGHACLRGEIKNKEEQYNRFKNDPDCQFLVAHPKSGGEGLNLQEASVAVFFSNGYEGATTRQQAEGRIWRLGQKKPCLFIDIVVHGSIDEQKLERVESDTEKAKKILDYIQHQV